MHNTYLILLEPMELVLICDILLMILLLIGSNLKIKSRFLNKNVYDH